MPIREGIGRPCGPKDPRGMGPCYFFDRVGITPLTLFESWSRAQREQSFGGQISWRERAKFMSFSNWGTMLDHVRRSVSEVQQAHRASQKLGTILIDAIGELGETDDFASVAPHYTKLTQVAREDVAFKILGNPLKTESLRAVFPDDEDEVLSLWRTSSETVRASIDDAPSALASTGLGLEHIEKATLDAARAANGAAFGDVAETLAWLRESAMWAIGEMWRHVRSFAFVAAMLFAVVVTYCMLFDREYTSDVAVVAGPVAPRLVDVRTGQARFGAGALGDALAGRAYASGVCGVIYSAMDCIVRMILATGSEGLASAVDGLFGARGATELAGQSKDVAKWSAIMTAERNRTITSEQASVMIQDMGKDAHGRILRALRLDGAGSGEARGTTRKLEVTVEEATVEELKRLYEVNEEEIADTLLNFMLICALQAQERAKRATSFGATGFLAGLTAEGAQYAAFTLGSIILLSYLLGPVVAGALVISIGAGAFASGLLEGNSATAPTAPTFQAVMIGASVFAGLIMLMPVSSDEEHVTSSLAGMVKHTTTQVSGYRAQTAKVEQDDASTAMYGATDAAFTHDAQSAAALVHGGAAMHVLDATRFGAYV
jgi:hypothetical protein